MIVGVRLNAPTDAAAADVQAALPRASALRALLETRNATSQQALSAGVEHLYMSS